jgi:hypothetical protein
MQPTAETEQNTPAKWESLIAALTGRADACDREAKELAHERDGLLLDAEMGVGGATKRVAKLEEEIAQRTREAAQKREAIQQAKSRLAEARQTEAAEAEHSRQKELCTLASAAMRHAGEFSASLRQAASADAALKLVIQNMLSRATQGERKNIDRLLERGPYMRAAEHAGLRACLDFAPYTGPQEHLAGLNDALAVHLGAWITANRMED